MNHEMNNAEGNEENNPENNAKNKNIGRFARSQWRLFFLVLVVGLSGLYFFALVRNGLNDSAALYVGLPVLIALGMSLTPRSKSAVGATLKGLTIALLLSVPIIQEGFICVILASPILYGVAVLIAMPIDSDRKKQAEGAKGTKVQVAFVSMLVAISALEGTHDALSFNRHNQVEASRIVNADMATIRSKLAETPTFEQDRSFFIRIFPLPVTAEGSGLSVGSERRLHFVYNKWFYFFVHEGDTVFRVVESQDNYVRFDVPHDDSYLSHYLAWEESEVFLEKVSEKQTRVTWRLGYERKLDPIWYFGPMQHYAAGLTAETLIDNVADPAY